MCAFLTNPASPLLHATVLLTVALILAVCRRWRPSAACALLAAAWALLCVTPAFALLLEETLERAYPVREAADYPKASAIVVLGGGEARKLTARGSNEPHAQPTRVGFGLQLWKEGLAPLIVVTGKGDAQEMAEVLRAAGVPRKAVWEERKSNNTHENANLCAQMLASHGIRRILLVTARLHISRAAAAFRREGFDVISAPVPERSKASEHEDLPLDRSTRALHEFFGRLAYILRGWA